VNIGIFLKIEVCEGGLSFIRVNMVYDLEAECYMTHVGNRKRNCFLILCASVKTYKIKLSKIK
jgi:hypothetical protein